MSRYLFVILLLLGLTACVSTQEHDAGAAPAWQDRHFTATEPVPTRDEIFALSPEMAATVRRLARSGDPKGALLQLIRRDGGIQYDTLYTRDAATTFASRRGNCMSLVVMTASLAEALALPYKFQLVESPPVWDRQGDIYLINGHVNLRLGTDRSTNLVPGSGETTVDFLPGNQLRGYRVRRLGQAELLANYYNNLAAEALVAGERDKAYFLVKAALQEDPNYGVAWNTLGVLYRQAGLEREAEQVYRYVLSLENSELNALHNLAVLLAAQGRLQEWQQVHAQLELRRIRNPFYYFDMGETAFRSGEFRQAVGHYRKALDLADYHHEFHFGLSRAYYKLGRFGMSETHLERAEDLAPVNEKGRYQMKLTALQRGRP